MDSSISIPSYVTVDCDYVINIIIFYYLYNNTILKNMYNIYK